MTSGAGDEVLPACPARLDEVVVVSPFLSSDFVRAIGGWGPRDAKRSLLADAASPASGKWGVKREPVPGDLGVRATRDGARNMALVRRLAFNLLRAGRG